MLRETVQQQINNFQQDHPHGVVILRGATATGKTGLSVELAKQIPLEVISADSRQVYTGMNIGTDKISPELRAQIPHHLIDVISPEETYTAGQWKHDAYELIPQIQQRGNTVFVVGGTGLYIDMLYKNFLMPEVAPDEEWRAQMMEQEHENPGFLFAQLQQVDPEEAAKHHPNSLRYILRALEIHHFTGEKKSDLARENPVDWPLCMIGLRREKEDTNRRINARIKEMFAEGLVAEVQGLLDKGIDPTCAAMQGIGYKEIVGYLHGDYDLDKAGELLRRNSHRYAKRQRSRFRRYIAESKQMPKEDVVYHLHQLT